MIRRFFFPFLWFWNGEIFLRPLRTFQAFASPSRLHRTSHRLRKFGAKNFFEIPRRRKRQTGDFLRRSLPPSFRVEPASFRRAQEFEQKLFGPVSLSPFLWIFERRRLRKNLPRKFERGLEDLVRRKEWKVFAASCLDLPVGSSTLGLRSRLRRIRARGVLDQRQEVADEEVLLDRENQRRVEDRNPCGDSRRDPIPERHRPRQRHRQGLGQEVLHVPRRKTERAQVGQLLRGAQPIFVDY